MKIYKKRLGVYKQGLRVYKIKDMHCASCATLIQMDLEDAGYKCKCSYIDETLTIEGEHNFKKIAEIVKSTGYTLVVS